MRLVYLDEAGISNPKHEPYITMAGIMVHGDHLSEVEKHIQKLVRKHIPENDRDSFVFHATEIFSGGKTIRRNDPYWSHERRFAIADDLAKIPGKFNLRIMLGWVERAQFPKYADAFPKDITEKQKTMSSLAVAFLNCSVYVELWMKKHAKKENCIMIIEDNRDARELLRQVQSSNQKEVFDKELKMHPKLAKAFPFKHIREDPLFQSKRPGSILEVADFCAFIWKRILMEGKSSKFSRFFDPWRSQIFIP